MFLVDGHAVFLWCEDVDYGADADLYVEYGAAVM